VVTVDSTQIEHFFSLRVHPDAQPEFEEVAFLMLAAYRASAPHRLNDGEWHLPFITAAERWEIPTMHEKIMVAVARCARATARHAGGYKSVILDMALYKRLRSADPPHVSPFEHVAVAMDDPEHESGNIVGFEQWRKVVERGLEAGLSVHGRLAA
jgi:hypothetical protein